MNPTTQMLAVLAFIYAVPTVVWVRVRRNKYRTLIRETEKYLRQTSKGDLNHG